MKRLLLVLLLLVLPLCLAAKEPQVGLISLRGPINPVSTAFLKENLAAAGKRGDRLLLVELDTPGGLDSAMREAVQAILGAPVPVAVYVAPSGARAASAGAVIALSADILAMAPGTNIGAAHPVGLGGKPDPVMEAKLVNDAEAYVEGIAAKRGRNTELARRMVRQSISLSAEAALAQRVIDLVAPSRQDLLARLEGRKVQRGGEEIVLHLAGARVVGHEMGTRDRILDAISNPDVAYMLMLLGILGLFFELSNPGVILPGVIGGISLLLSFFALQTLPVNYAGIGLILLGIILFIAEIKVVSYGMLAVGGVVAMVLGSLILFPSPEPYLRLSWGVLAGTVGVTALFFAVVVVKVIQAHRAKPITGVEGMLGELGVADTDLVPEGRVLLRGEYWNASSEEPLRKGEKVQVVAVTGLRLTVRKAGEKEEVRGGS
ncbi:nodulation protein NfeD [Geomonas sp. Red69]|uniref:Nodulation protein NfeD n=1 Tax=Geomonas diazotrophica TaxID=2843197 RepID=A0ABX8JED8_9BACT|nr:MULTISPECIES: nodulation protein NfeD [Geomonas]MBU5637820.1 nodulation protein NfeD [Geomonas diazotrophica]QWV96351.1 nodulation protein NfeD [Geomonas nitrogeniifigens]